MPRFRITSLIVFVALIAGGLGAMRYGSEALAKTFTTLLLVAMLIGLTGAIILRKSAWIGFSVFVVGYVAYDSFRQGGEHLGDLAIKTIADGVHPGKISRPAPPGFSSPYLDDLLSNEGYTAETVTNEIEAINDRHFLQEDLKDGRHSHNETEMQTLELYQRQLRTYHEQAKLSRPRLKNAITIGNASLTLALGWVGAIVGRSLEKRQLALSVSRTLDPQPTMTS